MRPYGPAGAAAIVLLSSAAACAHQPDEARAIEPGAVYPAAMRCADIAQPAAPAGAAFKQKVATSTTLCWTSELEDDV